MMGTKLSQRGDTIVEVLISIAIVTLVLATAYATASRSTKNSMQSQEHSRALKVAETQLDLLKAYAAQSTTDPNITGGSGFCLQIVSNTTITSYASTNPVCIVKDGNVDRYKIDVKLDPTSHVFTDSITWPSIITGTDKVQLVYRVQ